MDVRSININHDDKGYNTVITVTMFYYVTELILFHNCKLIIKNNSILNLVLKEKLLVKLGLSPQSLELDEWVKAFCSRPNHCPNMETGSLALA